MRCEGRGYGERMSGLSGVCGASHPFPPLGPARSPWRIRSSAELQPSPTHHVPSKANLDAFDKTLKACWEWEVVSEEAIRAWQEDERAARLLQVFVRVSQSANRPSHIPQPYQLALAVSLSTLDPALPHPRPESNPSRS